MKQIKYDHFRFIFLLLLVFFSVPLLGQTFTMSGYVTDKKSGETLLGVSVFLKNGSGLGTSTNEFGFYSLTLPEGKYQVAVSYMGYDAQMIQIELRASQKIDIQLTENTNMLSEVIISSNEENKSVTQALMGVEKLNVATISKLPVLFGERDILKTMQLQPGVKSAGDGQSGFTVRGGSLDQNLILLDDAPVYNASHLLGFFSIFNSDAIKDITLYKGTAPAPYGGRISSVVDVKMKEGDNQNYRVRGGIGLISSKLNIEGPIQNGKSSFLLTGRRTYADVFLKQTEQYQDDQLYFYDLNGKFNYRFSDQDRLFISGYSGRDALGLTNRFNIDWGNTTATVRWNHLFNDKLFSNTSFIYSNYDYNIDLKNNANPFSILSRIRDWNLKQEFQYFPNSKNEWKFGYNVIHHTVTPGQITAEGSTSNPYQIRNGLESALYFSNSWETTDRLTINYGLRLSDFTVLGGSDYYVLDDNRNVIDTISSRSAVKKYFNFEPRFSMSYLLNKNSSVKASYTRNTQNLHLISNSVITSPTDKWIMNTNIIKPEIGDQLSLGYFRNLKENMFELSAEAYYKLMQNQIDYKDNADERAPIIETQLLYGKGQAYGVELFLKKNKGNLTGWIGYTLSRTEKKIDGINQNQWYAARQDRTHDISIVGMYDLSKRWNISAVFVYQTGNAVTFPSGKYEVAGQTTWFYTERNGYRIAAYHRLDVGATYKLKERKHLRSELSFSLYNAYGHENPAIITFEQSASDPDKTVAVQTALFRWVPSISWNFKIN